ncbi:hypothetical protein SDC9_137776 [bioreactor metagenome]|uniref:Uncharacterized protein n=1 Tax=bioreactor metagenome TaxID=1076179 RepID=A0A645DMI9_9ZZZZ
MVDCAPDIRIRIVIINFPGCSDVIINVITDAPIKGMVFSAKIAVICPVLGNKPVVSSVFITWLNPYTGYLHGTQFNGSVGDIPAFQVSSWRIDFRIHGV